jgi:tRNA(Ile)-lysidine synthase
MIKQLQNTIHKRRLFSHGRHILVAVSGGADSVALLCALHEQTRKWGIRLTVAHLNHKIRGKAADRDSIFVRQLARKLRIPVVTGEADVPQLARKEGWSLEMAARQARYDFLVRTAKAVRASAIATAHTADDQAETVLLKLVRGAGAKGLAGIPYETVVRGIPVIRPMLDLTRKEIVAYLQEKGQEWREDETNRDESFLRNKVRRKILPLLEAELNPKVRSALRRTADILREEDRWLDGLAASLLAKCRTKTGGLDIALLKKRNLAERRRILRLWLVKAGVPAEWVDFDGMDRIEHLLEKTSARETINMAGPWTVTRQHGDLQIGKGSSITVRSFRENVRVPGKTVIKQAGLNCTVSVGPGLIKDKRARLGVFPARASLNWPALRNRRLTVRSWKPGDRMKPLGMKGSKKLQDIFVDEKVPFEQRQRLPLLECAGEIVWLPGYRVARGWEVRRPGDLSLQITVDRSMSSSG